uniref:Uncharacterized protein n=2 Tax=Glossina austeni TaxID=7395 RepID=A0A1A9V0B8_GLOAU
MMTKCDKTSSIENKSTTTLGKRAAQNVLKLFSNLNLSTQQLDDVLDRCDVVSVEDHFINDDIASLSTASNHLDLQYTKSLTTKNAKLFPNSLPSVRHSRRRLQQTMTTENAFFASYSPYIAPCVFPALQQESFPVQASIAQVSQTRQLKTNTTRLTPKKLKANCSKKKILLQVKSGQTTNIAGDNNNDMKQRNCHKSSHHRSSSYIYIPKNAITTLSLALNHSKQKHQQQQQKASSLPSSSILTFASSSAETSVTPLGQENTLALPPRTSSSSSSSLAQALSHTSLHQSYHSQQSSLISYDRSCSTSRQSLQTHAAATDSAKQNDKHSVQSIILDDTFLSSGISCPSETQSEASTNSPTFHKSILQRLSMAISSKNIHAENTSNAEDNVLISNELTTTTTNKNQQEQQEQQQEQQHDQTQQRQHKQQQQQQQLQQQQQCCNIVYSNEPKLSALREDANVFTTLLPATDLCSLNKCRNRNAVWMHATNSNSYWLADDLQLSDIEEQLHKMQLTQSNCFPQNDNNIESKNALSNEGLHKSKTLGMLSVF